MTRETLITRADKALWLRARRSVIKTRDLARGRQIDGETANLIAAYVEGRISPADKRRLGRMLVRNRMAAEAFMAAREVALQPEEAPQALRAVARHAYTPPRGGKASAMPVFTAPSLPRLWPVWGWVAASLIAIGLAIGGFLVGQESARPVADSGNPAETGEQSPGTLDTASDDVMPAGQNGVFDPLDLDF